MSTYCYETETYGDLHVAFEYGKGWGGNGEKPYHCLLSLHHAEDEDKYLIVAMTPEDALQLSAALCRHAFRVHEGEVESFDEWGPEVYLRDFEPEIDPEILASGNENAIHVAKCDAECDRLNEIEEALRDAWDEAMVKAENSFKNC